MTKEIDPRNVIIQLWNLRATAPIDSIHGQAGTETATKNVYLGRVVFEFFQNAIDRAEKRVSIELDAQQKVLIFANDARKGGQVQINETYDCHNVDDFHSLCNIHLSSKEVGKSIGNKGVGFKSAWEFAECVTIASTLPNGRKWGFRFFRDFSLGKLKQGLFWKNLETENPVLCNKVERCVGDASPKEDAPRFRRFRIPSFYFPDYVENVTDLFEGRDWATTVIRLDGINPDGVKRLRTLIEEFRKAELFFVNQLRDENGKFRDIKVEVDTIVDRLKNDLPKHTGLKHAQDEGWLILSAHEVLDKWADISKTLQEAARKLDLQISDPSLAIAFPPTKPERAKDDATANQNGGLFYSYLPTEVPCGFGGILVHGDFLLDISRKGIETQGNDYNKILLQQAGELLAKALLKHPELQGRPDVLRFATNPRSDKVPQCFVDAFRDTMELYSDNETAPFRKLLNSLAAAHATPDLDFCDAALCMIRSWDIRQDGWADWRKQWFARFKAHVESSGLRILPADEQLTTVFPLEKEAAIFWRNPTDKQITDLDALDCEALKGFAVTVWNGLTSGMKETLDVREFRPDELARRLASKIRSEYGNPPGARNFHEKKFNPEKLLRLLASLFTPQARDDNATPLAFMVGRKDNPSHAQNLAWMPVPVVGNKWAPGFLAYFTDQPDLASVLQQNARFFALDLPRFVGIVGHRNDLAADQIARQIAQRLGVWPCLPLEIANGPDGADYKLPLLLNELDNSHKPAFFRALVHAWPYWSRAGDLLKPVRESLLERGREWFPLQPEHNPIEQLASPFAAARRLFRVAAI